MQVQALWNEDIPAPMEDKGLSNQVWQCSLSSDHLSLTAIVGDLILCYELSTGQMLRPPIKSLHKQHITCLAQNLQGTKLATGSQDKLVVIWHSNFTPEIKYSHSDCVQCLVFNPVTNQLFSAGVSDYILFTPGATSPDKFKSSSKILCCDYSPDGQVLAYGTIDGKVVLLSKTMQTIQEINFGNLVMNWCVRWSPITPEHSNNTLVVGRWDKKVTYLSAQGKVLAEKSIGNEPLAIRFLPTAEFMLVSETDNTVNMYTRDLQFIQKISTNTQYMWDLQLKPTKHNQQDLYLAQVGNEGRIQLLLLNNQLVNSFYRDKYVSRIDITDILIQQIEQDRQLRIKCRELVKNISIYKHLLAVQLKNQILIYQQSNQDNLKYKLLKKLSKSIDCEQIVLSSHHIVFSWHNKVVMLGFTGTVEREWVMGCKVDYVKCCGGAEGREVLVVGLHNGQVHKVCLDNPFTILLAEHNIPILQLDVNRALTKLAVIDANHNLTIWLIQQKKQVFSEMNVESVAFNQDFQDLLTYSGQGMLFVKCGSFPPSYQKFKGKVIGFKGNQLFLLDSVQKLVTIDVPQTANLTKYMDNKQFDQAYQLACLGVTEQDFHLLGVQALSNAHFEIAQKCFLKIQDLNYLDLTNKYQQEYKQGHLQLVYLQAQLQAYQKNFQKAGQILTENNMTDKAVHLFSELKRWEEAKKFIVLSEQQKNNEQTPGGKQNKNNFYGRIINTHNSPQMQALIREQADYLLKIGDWLQACQLLTTAKDYKQVIEIYGDKKALDQLIEVCRQLDKSDNQDLIKQCAMYFKKNQNHSYAKEAYLKLGDNKSLMELHIQLEKWEEAFILAKQNEKYMLMLRLPYAEYLCKNDRYEDALKVYRKINRPDISLKILKQMSNNAVDECRYLQAGQFQWNLGIECLVKGDMQEFHQHSMISEVYCAYQVVYQFLETGHCSINGASQLLVVFNASRYLANMLNKSAVDTLPGINKVYIYYALAKVANQLQAFKTARLCYEKLQKLTLPSHLAEEVELNHLLTKSKPFSDAHSLFSLCNRCLNANQILQNSSVHQYHYTCLTCQHPFIISFASFQNLALVEFQVDSSLTHQQVLSLINGEKDSEDQQKGGKAPQNDGWDQNNNNNNYNIKQSVDQMNNTPFFQKMNETCEIQLAQKEYLPIQLSESQLKHLKPEEVFWVDYSKFNPKCPVKYFKNMQPDVQVDNCTECGRFFLLEEYELEFIIKKRCPFCNHGDKKLENRDDNI